MTVPAPIAMKTFVTAASPHDETAPHTPSSTPTSPKHPHPYTFGLHPRVYDDDDATMVDIDLEAPDARPHKFSVCIRDRAQRNFFGMEKVTRGGVALRILTCVVATVSAFGVTYAMSVTYLVVGEQVTGGYDPALDPEVFPFPTPSPSSSDERHAAFIHATLFVSLYGSAVVYAAVIPIAAVIALVRKTWRTRGGYPGFHAYLCGLAVQCIPTAIAAIAIGLFLAPMPHDKDLMVMRGLVGLVVVGFPLKVALFYMLAKNPDYVQSHHPSPPSGWHLTPVTKTQYQRSSTMPSFDTLSTTTEFESASRKRTVPRTHAVRALVARALDLFLGPFYLVLSTITITITASFLFALLVTTASLHRLSAAWLQDDDPFRIALCGSAFYGSAVLLVLYTYITLSLPLSRGGVASSFAARVGREVGIHATVMSVLGGAVAPAIGVMALGSANLSAVNALMVGVVGMLVPVVVVGLLGTAGYALYKLRNVCL
ncbi:hypothetical protein K466DRAFT_564184 [Polyporus arcularius HHB13444]|uniref:Transmembrane protein n=1 Tax=Polyporus arcularius HHB13444 TaxID=1314778 RepID=A0A5C3PM35_9APHY|nr:hypothetical protein K466DRAFT_564184 [Polyporus arcularius HHB13444]